MDTLLVLLILIILVALIYKLFLKKIYGGFPKSSEDNKVRRQFISIKNEPIDNLEKNPNIISEMNDNQINKLIQDICHYFIFCKYNQEERDIMGHHPFPSELKKFAKILAECRNLDIEKTEENVEDCFGDSYEKNTNKETFKESFADLKKKNLIDDKYEISEYITSYGKKRRIKIVDRDDDNDSDDE